MTARLAQRFVYDPNYRPRLTTADKAARTLLELAPHCWLVTPSHPGVETWVEAVPAPSVVDQTGAGDAYVGTLTARLVQGDDLLWAAQQAGAAASLVVGGRGGTGYVPTLDETRAHLTTAGQVAR